MNVIQRGFWAGVSAAGPMSISLFKFFHALPISQRSALPPAILTAQVTRILGIEKPLQRKNRSDLSMASHYGYSIACGILYAALQKHVKASTLVKGGAFGLGVWAASYMGWIPALGLRASAYQMPIRRNMMMIVSHLIWGVGLSLSEEEMRRHGHQMLDGHHHRPGAE